MHTGDSAGVDATKIKVDLVTTILMEVGEVEHMGGIWISIDMFSKSPPEHGILSWIVPEIDWKFGIGGGNISGGKNGGWRSRRFLEETKVVGVSENISVDQSAKGVTIEEGGGIWNIVGNNGNFKNVAISIGGKGGGRFDT